MTKSNRRRKESPEARATRAQRQQAEERRQLTLRQYQMRRFGGWSLIGVGVAVGVSHWLSHLGLWRFASEGVMDLAAGYPTAALLGVAGSIVLSKA
ncbi:MAG: hypothetical protein WD186_00550 [Actinomycetota bacterium]